MKMPCPTCKGSGFTNLSGPLLKTIEVIKVLGERTVPEIYRSLPDSNKISPTAANRRVNRLLKMNLIKKVAKSNPARYEVV